MSKNFQEMAKNDPVGYLNLVSGLYKQSLFYKYQKDEMIKEMRSAASCGGFKTSGALEQRVDGLLSVNLQKFLNIVFQIQGLYPEKLSIETNPVDYLNSILLKYQPTAAYNSQKQQALNILRNNAAAGGYAGSESHQTKAAEIVANLMCKDMLQFIDQILAVQQMGVNTTTQHKPKPGR